MASLTAQNESKRVVADVMTCQFCGTVSVVFVSHLALHKYSLVDPIRE